jgi:hypothetical protein
VAKMVWFRMQERRLVNYKKNPGGAKFFDHVQTGLVAHPASCTMGTMTFPEEQQAGVVVSTHPLSSAEVKKG